MNIVILLGNITRDPELRYTPQGTAVLELGLAVNDVWFDDQNQKHEEVTFVDCRVWGKRGETMAKCFGKGGTVLIHGELKQERWEDKVSGKSRSKTLVIVKKWEFAGDSKAPGRSRGQDEPPDRAPRHTAPQSDPRPDPQERSRNLPDHEGPITDGMEDDDIPF